MIKSFASFLIDHKHGKNILTYSEMLAIFTIFLILIVSLNGVYPNTLFFGIDKVKGLSIFNQAVWSFVFFLSLTSLLMSKKTNTDYFVVSLPLILFCCFFFLSALWSLAPSITIRRSTLELFVILAILFSVYKIPSTENVFNIFYRVAQYILCLNLIMLLMQNGFDNEGFFQGVHFQKNYTGMVATFSIFIGFFRYFHGPRNGKLLCILYILLWTILLLLSQSKTSIGLLLISPLILFFLRIINKNITVSLIIIFSLLFLTYAFVTIIGYDILRLFINFVNEVGFTGRDDIWQFLIGQISQRPFLGFGYGGFWDIGLKSPNIVYGTGYVPFIGQAHNGYIDIVLNIGFVGLFFFALIIIQLLGIAYAIPKRNSNGLVNYCFLFIIFAFLHNLTESSFIRAYSFTWIMFLFSISIIYKTYISK